MNKLNIVVLALIILMPIGAMGAYPYPYDLNMDGIVGTIDYYIIYAHWNETTYYPYPNYDINKDGIVNMSDIELISYHGPLYENVKFTQQGESYSADVNRDGVVNRDDLIEVAKHFNDTIIPLVPINGYQYVEGNLYNLTITPGKSVGYINVNLIGSGKGYLKFYKNGRSIGTTKTKEGNWNIPSNFKLGVGNWSFYVDDGTKILTAQININSSTKIIMVPENTDLTSTRSQATSDYDVNEDTKIDLEDLRLVSINFGKHIMNENVTMRYPHP